MLTEALPATLDMRKMAVRGVVVQGRVAVAELPRLRSLLATDNGSIEARCRFFRDEEERSLVEIAVTATLEVPCQRCLEATSITLHTESTLCILAGETQAQGLPGNIEPLIAESGVTDLWAVIEDELLLGLPIVSYHGSGSCADLTKTYSAGDEPEVTATRTNPFEVLRSLKQD